MSIMQKLALDQPKPKRGSSCHVPDCAIFP